MTTTTIETGRPSVAAGPAAAAEKATYPMERMRRTARRWRYLSNAGAALVSVVLLVWTITPLYNMLWLLFEREGDVAGTCMSPP